MTPDLARAVEALRVYNGSSSVPMNTQRRFYNRARKLISRVATTRGMSEAQAWEQIEGEARRLGPILPKPGKDY